MHPVRARLHRPPRPLQLSTADHLRERVHGRRDVCQVRQYHVNSPRRHLRRDHDLHGRQGDEQGRLVQVKSIVTYFLCAQLITLVDILWPKIALI